MSGEFTVAQLISQLRSAQAGITVKPPNVTAQLDALERSVFDVVEQAEPGDTRAQPIFQNMQRAKVCLDTAFERRYAAARAIEDYLQAHFTGANVQTGSAVYAPSTGSDTLTWEDSARERRERRKRANGWAWADIAVFIAEPLAEAALLAVFPGAPLVVAATMIIAKLGYTAWKVNRTHADRREARKLLWEANGDAFVDMGWEIAGALRDAVSSVVPGFEVAGALMELLDTLKDLKDLQDIHSDWKTNGGG